MFRRAGATARRAVGTVQGSSPAQGLVNIFGSDLLEVWDAESGITLSGSNVTSWRGALGGRYLTPPTTGQRPAYAVDTGYFLQKPVVQFSATSGLINSAINLGIDGDLMGAILVARIRTLPTPVDTNPFRYLVTCMGNRTGANGDASYRLYFRMQTDSTRGWAMYQRTYGTSDPTGTHGWTNGGAYNADPIVMHGPVWATPTTSYRPYFYDSTVAGTWIAPAGNVTGGFKSLAIGNTANTDPLDCMDVNVAALLIFRSYTLASMTATRDQLHGWMRTKWGTT